jgi:hypothetical protein
MQERSNKAVRDRDDSNYVYFIIFKLISKSSEWILKI